ncbi:MAG: class I SAM-dependent methyltransferase [Lentisphaeria bacterium]|nr:class I SAM-dependent methyltransferase [Lentisphaeria bacterium]
MTIIDHIREPKRIAVRVRRKAVASIRKGHPWLFEDSAERCTAGGSPGDTAVLFDPDGKLLGAGLYDPGSRVLVKILPQGSGLPPVGPDLFRILTEKAAGLRAGKIPSGTTAWRLINGESDGFPGLAADRYENIAVIKLYSAAWPVRINQVSNAIQAASPDIDTFVIRLSRELQAMSPEIRCGLSDGDIFPRGADNGFDGKKVFRENGILFQADLKSGQKTGFFLDQRDNRARAEKLAQGLDVLNVFCFSGGFSLYAARGGARSVTSVDADRHALEECAANFKRNAAIPNIAKCRHTEIRGDAFAVMTKLAEEGKKFGFVIVDPPSFAQSAESIPDALKSYGHLAKCAMRLLAPGGILAAASCSSRVSPDDFFHAVENAAGGAIRVFDRTFHGADHPALFPESGYLKCLWAKRCR